MTNTPKGQSVTRTGVWDTAAVRALLRPGPLARADRAIAPDMVFLPFACVETAANILTNPALDPYGKIPEFKFSAVRVEKAGQSVAAE